MKDVRQFDVVVVGSGASGSAAAMTAARQGAKVALVEKLDSPGGSAALSAGMFWTAPSIGSYRARIPLGMVELGERLVGDYEEALGEIRAAGIKVASEPKRDIMTFGVGYSIDILGLLTWCRDQVTKAGGEVIASAAVRDLLREDGRLAGVVADLATGGRMQLRASTVVLASGGFQGARDELTRHIGRNADRLLLRSNPGSVGDGLRLARSTGGGGTTAMSTFYGHLLPWPVKEWTTEHFLPYSQYYSGSTILVNLRGERFVDETLGDEILNQDLVFQPEARGVLIFDDHVRRTEVVEEPFPGLGAIDRLEIAINAGGAYTTAPTLDALARNVADWGLDPDVLGRTVDSYLRAVESGASASLGVPVSTSARAPRDAPFHAIVVQPSITFTFGGIRTDAEGQVLDHDGCSVPGLFAAGADIGGLSNYGYAGGLAPAYITGRWAGRSAAAASSFTNQRVAT